MGLGAQPLSILLAGGRPNDAHAQPWLLHGLPLLRTKIRPPNFDVPPMETELRANFGYEILVGLYDFETGSRLLVLDDSGEPVGDRVRLEQEITIRGNEQDEQSDLCN